MTKKPEAMPLSSLFIERRQEPVTPFDPAKGGVVVDLADTTMKRLRFELRLPTVAPDLPQAVEDERDSCASEFATRQLKASAVNRENAEAQRKAVSREELERLRNEYMYKMQADKGWPEGRDHGWKEYALDRLLVRITRKTLDARWKGK